MPMPERVDLDDLETGLYGDTPNPDREVIRALVAELRDARVSLDQYRDYASRLEVQLAEAERIIARFTTQRLKDAAERDRASGEVP